MADSRMLKHVLVVDDDRDMVRGLELYLKLGGVEVSCAYGGESALREIKAGNPSAVILDVMMPDIDGIEVCRRIRGEMGDAKTPVIILTALSDSRIKKKAMEAGASEYLTKPCDFERVYRTVEQMA